jgi:hypothetical protein
MANTASMAAVRAASVLPPGPAATVPGPAFFVSAWLLMLFAGIVASDVGIRPFGYVTSMVVTIGLWLVLAPAAGAIARTSRRKKT